jgi:predicted outer membrane repeat protein
MMTARKISTLFLAGLMSFALFSAAQPAPVAAAIASRIYVGFDVDGGNGGCDDPMFGVTTHGAKQAIGHALREASNGDTVYLCGGTYDLTTGIQIRADWWDLDEVSIQGAGDGDTVLDGNGDIRILYINGDIDVSIRDLEFYDGYDEYDGGAICQNNGNLLVENVTFDSNYSADYGGAIACEGDSLTVLDSTFSNNYAERHGGAIDVHQDNGTIIRRSLFINNHSEEEGGALGSNGSDLTVTNSEFIGNTSDLHGGAIWYPRDSGLIATRNIFTKNESLLSGGAIALLDIRYMRVVTKRLLATNKFRGNRTDSMQGAKIGYVSNYLD